jgi:hypothetical protein
MIHPNARRCEPAAWESGRSGGIKLAQAETAAPAAFPEMDPVIHRNRMLRLFVFALLAWPLAAPAQDPVTLRSGTPVRVILPGGPPDGAPGVLVDRRGDTLLVAAPALGLAHLSADEIQRLETIGPARGKVGTYAIRVLALSGALAVLAGGEPFPMFMNGVVIFGAGGAIAYALQPPRRAVVIDPAHGLPAVVQDPALPGVPVRISTESRTLTAQRMHGFSADSVYLFAEGRSTPVARAKILSLQVSTGRDRRRGARLGGRIGAAAGAAAGAGWALQSDSEFRFAAAPAPAIVGAFIGLVVGAPAGWALAPRRWVDVPAGPRDP